MDRGEAKTPNRTAWMDGTMINKISDIRHKKFVPLYEYLKTQTELAKIQGMRVAPSVLIEVGKMAREIENDLLNLI